MSMILTMWTLHTCSNTPCSFYSPTGSLGLGKSQARCALAVLLPTGCDSTVLSRSRPTSKTRSRRARGNEELRALIDRGDAK